MTGSLVALALGAFLLVAGVTFAVGMALLRLLPGVSVDRLAPPRVGPAGDASILRWEGQVRGWRRLVERLGQALSRADAQLLSRYRRRLALAGFHDPRAVALLLGFKALAGLVAGSAYTLYGLVIQRALPNVLAMSVILGGLGFFLPDLWLSLTTRRRQRDISNALPDVLDLMVVCVEAGMGFDAAVARIAADPGMHRSPLHDELLRMHLEVRAGRPREEAMRALVERVGTEDVKSVVTAFIQTEKLGTPLGQILRVQADASRVRRRHRAETRAQLAPLMMLFPTILFLLPSFMMVAMAPSLLRIFELLQLTGSMAGK